MCPIILTIRLARHMAHIKNLAHLIIGVFLVFLLSASYADAQGLGNADLFNAEKINESFNSPQAKRERWIHRRSQAKSASPKVKKTKVAAKRHPSSPPSNVVRKPVSRGKVSYRPKSNGVIRSSVLVNVGITATSSLVSRAKNSDSITEAMSGTFSDLTRAEFLVGDILCGTVGAVAGSMIPLPLSVMPVGLLGRALGAMPTIGLAMVSAQLGSTAISLMKEGRFSLGNLFEAIDIPSLFGQTVGAALGFAASAAILPGALGAVIGGMAGGYLGMKIMQTIFPREESGQINKPAEKASIAQVTYVPECNSFGNSEYLDLTQLTEEVKESYEAFISASESGDPAAGLLLQRYKQLNSELREAQRSLAAKS